MKNKNRNKIRKNVTNKGKKKGKEGVIEREEE
jgi:hypothetical protein